MADPHEGVNAAGGLPEKKTVLITGGSSGIGTAMVRVFSTNGYRVWFTYHTGRERADRIVSEYSEREVAAFHLEYGDRESHRALVEKLPGAVDILIHNAGLGTKTVEKVSNDVFLQDEAMMRVNTIGPLWLTRELIPGMVQRRFGKILYVSSVGGGITHFPTFHMADGMSKAALSYLGKHLQAAHSRDPIDVFVICPGATRTPMFEASTLERLDAEQRARLCAALPGGRLIEPDEIADLALFLCTPQARVLRGAVIDASFGLGVDPQIVRDTEH